MMNKNINVEEVLSALDQVEEPELHASLVSLHMIQNVTINEGVVSFDLILTTPACPLKKEIEESAREAVMKLGARKVNIQVKSIVAGGSNVSGGADSMIKNIIAIASGKGGVGKSTVAVNLAIALRQAGASVGLMDADIYGPNTHTMLGVKDLPAPEDGKIVPAEAHGIKLVSIGLMVDSKQPLIWRGPLLHSAIKQFVTDVKWGELDYLVVDLPPGTGDVQISLSQVVNVTAGVIVTLPQKVSVDDARRAAQMFLQVGVPVIGVIENMSYFIMPDGSKNAIFGEGGGAGLAAELNVPYLGALPIDPGIREGSDTGRPIIVYPSKLQSTELIKEIAGKIAGQISIIRKKN